MPNAPIILMKDRRREMIPIDKVNEAYQRVVKSDVKYRFVIDMASLKGG